MSSPSKIRGARGRARALRLLLVASVTYPCATAPLAAQATDVQLDTVRAGRFDTGKMWTFEYAPTEYFTETYGFNADDDWFRRARLAALRIPGCSASFVSAQGLVATNHHCVRGAITSVSRPGENLLDDGFHAATQAEERRIADYYADQLIAIEDVSAEVFAALDRATTDAERERIREQTYAAIRQRLEQQHAGEPWPIRVEVVGLYHGGRYSAYVFRRYTDVRLVTAAELQIGFFGGDADNFTYPRHALDFAFLRIYGPDGQPQQPEQHFTWSRAGANEGDVIFVIGNPGPTNRLNTVSQLEFLRDVQVPATIAWLEARHGALGVYRAAQPVEAEAMDVRNLMFSLSNSLKANTGRRAALGDATIMARRADAERSFRQAIQQDDALRARYGGAIDSMAVIQRAKTQLGPLYGAFLQLGNPTYSAATLRRAILATVWREAVAAGAPPDTAASIAAEITRIRNLPPPLEQSFLAARLTEVQRYLGDEHAITRAALAGATPVDAARRVIESSVLGDSARAAAVIAANTIPDDDSAMRLVAALLQPLRAYQAELRRLTAAEAELAQRLGRARFEVYGTSIPPDATFSPRITDGVVQGYPFNGTIAPAHTTFYGMYSLHHAFGADSEWDLPARWLPPPPGLELGTPLNFVSTADTYGGNSGSPAVTPDLALVGLNFDRNIEGLSRDFIYLPERGRNIMVDVRAILQALQHAYGGERVVGELLGNGTD